MKKIMIAWNFIKIKSSNEKNGFDWYDFLVKIDWIEEKISISDTFLSIENIKDKEDIYKLWIYFFHLWIIKVDSNSSYDYSFKNISLENYKIFE